jgi:putative addiction module CopG family antidote
MDIQLTPEMETFIAEQVRSGRYVDASDVVRDALRRYCLSEGSYESPELEAELLKAVEGPHYPLTDEVFDRIRSAAKSAK